MVLPFAQNSASCGAHVATLYLCSTIHIPTYLPLTALSLLPIQPNPIQPNPITGQAMSSSVLRIGGSEGDVLCYDVPDFNSTCADMNQTDPLMCLPMKRYEQLLQFASDTGLNLVFGLNAVYGAWCSSLVLLFFVVSLPDLAAANLHCHLSRNARAVYPPNPNQHTAKYSHAH